ncbi:hypothetical protein FHX80_12411 [Streptomyces brevispora]|uniref:Uncharacterized protein n=1 Tax=Streptomyces brevispora TaxID=887462 RepID=A0A561TYB0_9ACTN|nr:hypothetical protein [Streptomyces brevispora]TWF92092.1 hypothetical protein FHX80_12411 [Streptomyces brevispora]
MNRFHSLYGASPLHLLLVLCSFALTGYAGVRLLSGEEPWKVVVWFVGAALLHDLVLLPLYTVTDRAAQTILSERREPAAASEAPHSRQRWINYVRVPVFLSGVLLLTYFPLILRRVSDRYTLYTTLSADVFLGRWLLITAVLFALSAVALLSRMGRSRPPRQVPPATPTRAAPREPGKSGPDPETSP